MRLKQNRSGFTLLEIIIVIIIVGVLASLALPRFFRTVEYSRGTEALTNINAIRQSMERCYLQKGTYVGCDVVGNLDVEDPTTSPNAHFTYTIPAAAATTFTITATRNTRDGGNGGTITIEQTATSILRSGTGPFVGVQ